jgi:hypothetical protein
VIRQWAPLRLLARRCWLGSILCDRAIVCRIIGTWRRWLCLKFLKAQFELPDFTAEP